MQQESFGYLRPAKTAATREPGHLLSAEAAVGFGTLTLMDGDSFTLKLQGEVRR